MLFFIGWGFHSGICWLHTISEVFTSEIRIPNSNYFLAILTQN